MGFPAVQIRDDFNRASLGANYTNLAGTAAIVANQLAASVAPAVCYYNPTTYGPNVEAYCPISTLPGAGVSFDLGARVVDVGSIATLDGYAVRFTQSAGTDTISLIRITNGAVAATLVTFNQEVAAGDWIGIRIVGSTLRAYYRSGSSGLFTELGSVVDATYANAGNISFTIINTTTRINEYGANTYAPQPIPQRALNIPHQRNGFRNGRV